MKRLPLLLSLLLPALVPAAATAAQAPTYNRVTFQVQRSAEVANDRMRVQLLVQGHDTDPARLADGINRSMEWALKQARAAKGVTFQTGGYRTYPVYDKGSLQRWRASQALNLEGEESQAVTALTGRLQQRLQVSGMSFSVSAPARRAVRERLIGEVLAAFQARAKAISAGLGGSGYRLVSLNLGGSGGGPRPVAMLDSVRMASAAPAVEVGTSEVTVTATATIELLQK